MYANRFGTAETEAKSAKATVEHVQQQCDDAVATVATLSAQVKEAEKNIKRLERRLVFVTNERDGMSQLVDSFTDVTKRGIGCLLYSMSNGTRCHIVSPRNNNEKLNEMDKKYTTD